MAHADPGAERWRKIGYSSGTVYSAANRDVLSMGCLGLAAAVIGNQVAVQWGDHGGPARPALRQPVQRQPCHLRHRFLPAFDRSADLQPALQRLA